jgi:hypothetical protein
MIMLSWITKIKLRTNGIWGHVRYRRWGRWRAAINGHGLGAMLVFGRGRGEEAVEWVAAPPSWRSGGGGGAQGGRGRRERPAAGTRGRKGGSVRLKKDLRLWPACQWEREREERVRWAGGFNWAGWGMGRRWEERGEGSGPRVRKKGRSGFFCFFKSILNKFSNILNSIFTQIFFQLFHNYF